MYIPLVVFSLTTLSPYLLVQTYNLKTPFSLVYPKQSVYNPVYTRKSTSEGLDQDFTTLDAQRESAENYINSQKHEGWSTLTTQYNDGGFTGANLDRPAIQQLLTDIKKGGIDCAKNT